MAPASRYCLILLYNMLAWLAWESSETGQGLGSEVNTEKTKYDLINNSTDCNDIEDIIPDNDWFFIISGRRGDSRRLLWAGTGTDCFLKPVTLRMTQVCLRHCQDLLVTQRGGNDPKIKRVVTMSFCIDFNFKFYLSESLIKTTKYHNRLHQACFHGQARQKQD